MCWERSAARTMFNDQLSLERGFGPVLGIELLTSEDDVRQARPPLVLLAFLDHGEVRADDGLELGPDLVGRTAGEADELRRWVTRGALAVVRKKRRGRSVELFQTASEDLLHDGGR